MLPPQSLDAWIKSISPHLDEFIRDRLVVSPLPGEVEIISATDYLQPDRLRGAINTLAAEHNIQELAVAASLWNKLYNNALILAVLPPMTLLGIGVEASTETIQIIIQENQPQRILLNPLRTIIYPSRLGRVLPDQAVASGLNELHTFVLKPLFQHLHLLITNLNNLTHLPRSVMWGNTGNVYAYLHEQMLSYPGAAPACQSDWHQIIEQPRTADGTQRNPLHRIMNENVDSSEPRHLRQVCCLLFRLPEGEGYCGNCPFLHPNLRSLRA